MTSAKVDTKHSSRQQLDHSSHDHRSSTIKRLPHDVINTIKSSTYITSLEDVVKELIKNSLDGNASRIEIAVDLSKGSCVVEDDGDGIEPKDFVEGGGLGQIYHTSRHGSGDQSHGRHGVFLTSLSALSLLTITSRHHLHRSSNTIVLQQSKTVARLLPAPPRHELSFGAHGTRVTVSNLFGSMPVRVKQRAANTNHTKCFDTLKRDIVGLLLAWRSSVRVRLQSADGSFQVILSQVLAVAPSRFDTPVERLTSVQNLKAAPLLLAQAGYIKHRDLSSWVPVSATTPCITIRGVISVEPAPTKVTQFICLGIRPVPRESHNELFDCIDRAFNNSYFSVDANVSDDDARYPSCRPGRPPPIQKRSSRKAVDRWPMLVIFIDMKSTFEYSVLDVASPESQSSLHKVVGVLDSMLFQWLSAHHFKPQQRKMKSENLEILKSSSMPLSASVSKLSTASANVRSPSGGTSQTDDHIVNHSANRSRHNFSDWSRIKSGNSRFLENIWNKGPVCADSTGSSKETGQSSPFTFHINLPKSTNTNRSSADTKKASIPCVTQCADADVIRMDSDESRSKDDTISWLDPSSKVTTLINARTGCILTDKPSRKATISAGSSQIARFSRVPLRNEQKHKQAADDKRTPWLDDFLTKWKNPVLETTEKRIPSVFHESMGSEDTHRGQKALDAAFAYCREHPMKNMGAISRGALATAKVIAQVDRKFILVDLGTSSEQDSHEPSKKRQLVLVDQHAADERCRVEELLAEFCAYCSAQIGTLSPPPPLIRLPKPIHFEVSSKDATALEAAIPFWTGWGIIYDLETSTPDRCVRKMTVKSLPPTVAERCKLDPKLLLSILRAEAWKLGTAKAKRARAMPAPTTNTTTTTTTTDTKHPWLRLLASIPDGLREMINSRACRSAVMFNDKLDVWQCEALVRRLACCALPFQCAHGRPSMVPLVDLDCCASSVVGNGIPCADVVGGVSVSGDVVPFKAAFGAWQSRQTKVSSRGHSRGTGGGVED
ncbi:hypothetical protein EJ05DRAFT_463018 [Pseudovirgaria hyperparasitica]|uniref:MutL C-terminal dimerisation domain-containing protein n=1 Tax=Pseudovirgaria hyperparasitica TaxID=470096 RepID=A0A6A6W9Q0_9PEZI|nr:uncharacterized protein EJ05DRAFT_463018 [Pseudovirgaria hyperparasitica]KAF2759598.1 hypothetical protein EJ05DRAFT_463018 [Pseudovirgaria hyperparasitica]